MHTIAGMIVIEIIQLIVAIVLLGFIFGQGVYIAFKFNDYILGGLKNDKRRV